MSTHTYSYPHDIGLLDPFSRKAHGRHTKIEVSENHETRGRFTLATLKKDALAGTITGLMAIPLTVGICLMSDYPIQIGIATVVVACIISFITYLFRPGNHVGVPGVAAGLAPVLAMGIHKFGSETMPWLIFLTAFMQMLVWKFRLESYILKAVPHFLIEGLLAGVGLKIAMKFLPYTYETVTHSDVFWNGERISVIFFSLLALFLFIYLYKKFKNSSPGLPYIAIIGGSIALSFYVQFPMLHIDQVPLKLVLPFPNFKAIAPQMYVEMILFAAMLTLIDVIEQVMSNAAIEKMDPLGRKADSNNSLLVMWIGNMASSFFGGMTNLDGLAKSSTNRMAGAVTKMSALFVAAVFAVVLFFPGLLTKLPEFSLAVLMIFTGWKMIAGLYHVAKDGKYAFGLSMFCGILVFKLGIFEGLLIAIAVHSFITYVIYKHDAVPTFEIIKKFIKIFSDGAHPHVTETLDVNEDPSTGGLRYSSVKKHPTAKKTLNHFIDDWASGVNHHNLLSVVSTYDTNGLLWGTFAKELRAGHFHIKRYFEHLFEMEGVKVVFDSGEVRQYKDIYIKSGSYSFSYRKKGTLVTIPARYSFVCKKENTGWYILEHHSSEFPA
ncbi:nuclear transport factor 2 family protein [Candidatus Peregrinibacteria bacterium]|nr:nuclear transport factor 2 family protein [Candidatus Peregrinibacteria bacterium]